MASSKPIFNGVNLVSQDVEATVTFYRRLGVDIPDDAIWRTETGAHHVTVKTPGGLDLEFDSQTLAGVYNQAFEPAPSNGQVMIGFGVATREAVDAIYADLVDAGYRGLQPPWDAFWGGRAAVVGDPDGNPVGIQSPMTAAHRSAPPEI